MIGLYIRPKYKLVAVNDQNIASHILVCTVPALQMLAQVP